MEILIGSNIKRLRMSKKISQEQLSEAMNVSCAAVSKWERGETYPDITLLQPLAYYFGVSLDELMGYNANKIEQTIEDILSEYWVLCRKDFAAADELIVKARAAYPNDYRIMHRYMWHIAGGCADNDPGVLMEHKKELSEICQKISEGCRDHHIRTGALNMSAILLWAEGKTEEALDIYRQNFSSWYETVGQKSEQLFPKNTPGFLYWVRKNMYELADFAADKLAKVIFFDDRLPMKDRIEKIERYGDLILSLAEETDEPFFVIIAHSIYGRLNNDLKYRGGGTDADIIRTMDKYLDATRKLTEMSLTDAVLFETNTASHDTDNLLQWTVDYFLNAKHGKNTELLKNPEYTEILHRYKSN